MTGAAAAITLRAATSADLDAIAAIESACFDRPWTRAIFEQELERELARLDVACDGETLLGFACTWHVLDEAHLLRIAVAPTAQRRGIARRLLDGVNTRAAAQGCVHVDLEVAADNAPALALYDACGFVTIGRRPGYYTLPPGDALLLRAMLPRP
ncbi:MAG: ribosomal protein S18-alanine N-acetyltransferase [Deltaproteobacteria bacterium]|nr:ribosomal protein S18-alanine N-acetyltransferase [Nannocystaceae bacterium]